MLRLRLLLVAGTVVTTACQSARSGGCPNAGETTIPANWQMLRPGTILATLEIGRGLRVESGMIELERVGTTEAIRADISDGIFHIRGLEPGEYQVEISAAADHSWRGRVMLDATPGDTTRLRLRDSSLCAP